MSSVKSPTGFADTIRGSSAHRALSGAGERGGCGGGPSVSGWSRRSFLSVLGAVAAGTVAGCTGSGAQTQQVGDDRALGAPTKRPRRGVGDGYPLTAPYTLGAESELSEDYFLVANHRIDSAKDKVVAYSRADGQVEAMVLQDGVVKQIYRDPSQAGGWNVAALADADGVTDMVASVSAPTPDPLKPGTPVLTVCYIKSAHPDQLVVAAGPLTSAGSAPTSFAQPRTIPWSAAADRLQVTLNSDASILVAAVTPSKSSGQAKLWYYTDGFVAGNPSKLAEQFGTLSGFDYSTTAPANRWAAIATRNKPWGGGNDHPWLTLMLPGGSSATSVQIRSYDLHTGKPSGNFSDGSPKGGAPKPPTTGVTVVGVEALTMFGSQVWPAALIWTERSAKGAAAGDPRLWLLTYDGSGTAPDSWIWTELTLPDSVTDGPGVIPLSLAIAPRAHPADDGGGPTCVVDIFLVVDGVLQVFRQAESDDWYQDLWHPTYCPLIALQPGVATMTGQPGVSTGNELVVVDTDGNLLALEKDPNSGAWTETTVHVPASSLQQASAYRTHLTLTDAWNQPLPGVELTITASSPAAAMVEGDPSTNPQAVTLSPDQVTVTTDRDGAVILALLADGLSAPTLTITAQDLSEAVTVYPSGAVNTYMTGDTQTQLNYLDPLTPDTLHNAKTPQTDDQDAVVVAPGAANHADAADAVQNMSAAAVEAQHGAKLGRPAATVGRIDGRTRARHRRHGQRGAIPTVAVEAQIASIDHWAHDALHAIKKGAAKVSKVTHDLEHDTFVIAADFGAWADNAVSVVVHGIEDAAHVIHAEFNRLAADIVRAAKWLEAEVIGVFKDSKHVSDLFAVWLGNLGQFAGDLFADNEAKAVTWLNTERDKLTDAVNTLANRYPSDGPHKVTLSNMAQYSPGGLSGTRRRPRPGRSQTSLKDTEDNPPNKPHGNWFYNKIKHELFGSGLSLNLSTLPDLKTKVNGFGAKGAHTDNFVTDLEENLFKGFLKDVVKHPTDVNGVVVQPLLRALNTLINDAFDIAEDVVEAAAALFHDILTTVIPHMLNDTTLKDLPILGALMKLIGLGDVSIGRVVNLLFAFPATLTYKIAKGPSARPFAAIQQDSPPRHLAHTDIADDLQIVAASAMGTWAVFDTIAATYAASGLPPDDLFDGIDMAAPLLVTVLTTPATQDGEPFLTPPVTGKPGDILNFLAWVLGLIPGACVALGSVIDKTADEAVKVLYQERNMIFSAVSGVLALVFGMVGNSLTDKPSSADYAGAVVDNISTIVAPGTYRKIAEATDGISIVVTMALTLICGAIGAGVYGVDG